MAASISVRPAVLADVPELARVHVESWRETYRGLVRDEVLDDPGFLAQRERFWTAALTDDRFREHTAATALLGDRIVGVAMSGPPFDADAVWERQLSILYTSAAVHGRGAGAALVDAVIRPGQSVALWVADPNPRAQAFYRRIGFRFDGTERVDDGVRELRMVRRGVPTALSGAGAR